MNKTTTRKPKAKKPLVKAKVVRRKKVSSPVISTPTPPPPSEAVNGELAAPPALTIPIQDPPSEPPVTSTNSEWSADEPYVDLPKPQGKTLPEEDEGRSEKSYLGLDRTQDNGPKAHPGGVLMILLISAFTLLTIGVMYATPMDKIRESGTYDLAPAGIAMVAAGREVYLSESFGILATNIIRQLRNDDKLVVNTLTNKITFVVER